MTKKLKWYLILWKSSNLDFGGTDIKATSVTDARRRFRKSVKKQVKILRILQGDKEACFDWIRRHPNG